MGPPQPKTAVDSPLPLQQQLGACREACAFGEQAYHCSQDWVQAASHCWGVMPVSHPCSPASEHEDNSISMFHSNKHWPSCPASHHPFLVTPEPEPNLTIVEALALGPLPGAGPGITGRTEVWAPTWNTKGCRLRSSFKAENVFSSWYPQHWAWMWQVPNRHPHNYIWNEWREKKNNYRN